MNHSNERLNLWRYTCLHTNVLIYFSLVVIFIHVDEILAVAGETDLDVCKQYS